jgi:hypothetical protein
MHLQGKLSLNSHHTSEGWGRPEQAPLPSSSSSFFDIFIHAHPEEGVWRKADATTTVTLFTAEILQVSSFTTTANASAATSTASLGQVPASPPEHMRLRRDLITSIRFLGDGAAQRHVEHRKARHLPSSIPAAHDCH